MSSHLQRKFLAAQNMEVQVVHGLACVRTAVGDHPVAAVQAFCCGDLGNDLKNVSNRSAVFGGHIVHGGKMGLGNHQNMGRCLGIDVPEGIHKLVFIDLGRGDIPGDNFTEQSVRHEKTSLKA